MGWDGGGGPVMTCLGAQRGTAHYASAKGGTSGEMWKHMIENVYAPLWPDISPDNPVVMLKDGGPGAVHVGVSWWGQGACGSS